MLEFKSNQVFFCPLPYVCSFSFIFEIVINQRAPRVRWELKGGSIIEFLKKVEVCKEIAIMVIEDNSYAKKFADDPTLLWKQQGSKSIVKDCGVCTCKVCEKTAFIFSFCCSGTFEETLSDLISMAFIKGCVKLKVH